MGKAVRRIAVGAALAGAAGYLAGLLTAPKSGRETRQELAQAANTSVGELEKQLKDMHSELGKLLEDAKAQGQDLGKHGQKELDTLLDKAKVAKQKVREVISAVHEGDADDKDLKKAMSDARHAIDHIKDYLQK
jgi:gas vesicle protein